MQLWRALDAGRRARLFAFMRELDAAADHFFAKGREDANRIPVGAALFDEVLRGAACFELVTALRRAETVEAAAELAAPAVRLWVEKHNARSKDINWKRWTEAGQDELARLVQRAKEIAMTAVLPEYNDPETLYLIDLSGFVIKYWHVTPSIAARQFAGALDKWIGLRGPARVAIAEDNEFPTFRHELWQNYKGTRTKLSMADKASRLAELRKASEIAQDVHGVKCLWAKGFEADDVIATLAQWGAEEGLTVVILAFDKDFMQLVGPRVMLWDGKGIPSGMEAVKEKFGVSPAQIVDYLTIVGDTSDNVPGIHGIGEKGATELLNRFGRLDVALHEANAEGPDRGANHPFFLSKPKVWAKLVGAQAEADRARKLVTLRRDVPLDIESLDDLALAPA
jgi:5'-3' exonuclease